MLCAPWLLTLCVFWLFPLFYSLYLSGTDYSLLRSDYTWIGFANYTNLLSDPAFQSALKNTFVFTLGTIPATQLIAIFLALLVNRQFAGRNFFRSAFFVPSVTSLVVVSLIFTHLFSQQGYVATLAAAIGIDTPPNGYLLNSGTALYAIMVMDVWMAVGYYMLLMLAGLKSIPEELYETAELAGAGAIRKFFTITLPLLRPMIAFCLVVNCIKSFQVFVEIYVMTKGKYNTSTAVWHIYETGLTRFKFGEASAAAYILVAIIAVFSIAQFWILRSRQELTR